MNTIPDELIEDYREAAAGRSIAAGLFAAWDKSGDDTCWIIFPTGDDALNRAALKFLPEFLDRHYYRKAFLIHNGSCGDELLRFASNSPYDLYIERLNEKDMAALLKYYRLVQFSPKIVVISLEEPFALSGWIGNFGITAESFVRDFIYFGNTIAWMWWNVDPEAIRERIRSLKDGLSGKRIYIYGWTRYSGMVYEALQKEGLDTAGLLDSNKEKEGRNEQLGLYSFLPEKALQPYDPDARIFTFSKYSQEMRGRLNTLGYGDDQIIEISTAGDVSSCMGADEETLDREFGKAAEGYQLRSRINCEKVIQCFGDSADIFHLCSLLPDYLRRSGTDDYTLLLIGNETKTSQLSIGNLFGIGRMLAIPIEDMHRIIKAWEFLGDERMRMKPDLHLGSRFSRNIRPPKVNGHFPKYRNYLDCLRYQYFYYPGPLAVTRPKQGGMDENKYLAMGLRPGRTIVLAPYSYAFRPVLYYGTDMWQRLAAALTERGYCVCTNCFKPEEPIAGTTAVCPPYEEFVSFLNWAGAMIASRSGICDLAAGAADCKMIHIYEKGSGVLRDTASMQRMGLHDHTLDLLYTGDADIILRTILEEFPPVN